MTGLLEAQHIYAQYSDTPVLNNVSLSLKKGEVLGILGANGAGKTTLLRIMAGLYAAKEGAVLFDGKHLSECASLPQKLAYLDQSLLCHWPLEVEHLVGLGRMPHQGIGKGLTAGDKCAVKRAMEAADVTHLKTRDITTLSGGEQVRVFLARALAVEPEALLVDEPVAGLDPAHQLGVMELLQTRAQAGMAVACVLHDLTLAMRFCDRLALLNEGALLAVGPPHDVLKPDHLKKALKIEVIAGCHEEGAYVIPWKKTAD